MRRYWPKIQRVLGRTLLVLFVAYVLLNLGRSIQHNYEITRAIRQLKEEIVSLKQRIRQLDYQIVYFQSDAYRELEAKRRLGLKRPGETVVLVPQNVDPPTTASQQLKRTALERTPHEDLGFFEQASRNATSWWQWFIDPRSD